MTFKYYSGEISVQVRFDNIKDDISMESKLNSFINTTRNTTTSAKYRNSYTIKVLNKKKGWPKFVEQFMNQVEEMLKHFT